MKFSHWMMMVAILALWTAPNNAIAASSTSSGERVGEKSQLKQRLRLEPSSKFKLQVSLGLGAGYQQFVAEAEDGIFAFRGPALGADLRFRWCRRQRNWSIGLRLATEIPLGLAVHEWNELIPSGRHELVTFDTAVAFLFQIYGFHLSSGLALQFHVAPEADLVPWLDLTVGYDITLSQRFALRLEGSGRLTFRGAGLAGRTALVVAF